LVHFFPERQRINDVSVKGEGEFYSVYGGNHWLGAVDYGDIVAFARGCVPHVADAYGSREATVPFIYGLCF
jgi:hypothetical protein